MISLNDVLLARANIPVDDPIAEIWGRGLQGGYKIIEYTGSLPITINADGNVLIDYRIYGADGGVGEPTENLFDENLVTPKRLISDTTGEIHYYPYYDTTGIMDIENNFVITFVKSVSSYTLDIRVAFYDIQNDFISCSHKAKAISPLNITVPTGTKKVRVSYTNGTYDGSSYPNNLFIGLTAPTSYIPYGYKLPMTVSDGNTAQTVPVYIGESQLDAGEYVSFSEQKIYRDVSGTLTPTDPPVPLPQIPTIDGTTVIDYDGTPKPSQVYVKYKGKSDGA